MYTLLFIITKHQKEEILFSLDGAWASVLLLPNSGFLWFLPASLVSCEDSAKEALGKRWGHE
jgi:hypothetical protein